MSDFEPPLHWQLCGPYSTCVHSAEDFLVDCCRVKFQAESRGSRAGSCTPIAVPTWEKRVPSRILVKSSLISS